MTPPRWTRRALALAGTTLALLAGTTLPARAADTDVLLDNEDGYFAGGWLPNLREDGQSFGGGLAFDYGSHGADWSLDVTGFAGRQYGDTYVWFEAAHPEPDKGDAAYGNLTSPAVTITRPYLNLLIGGGRHPHEPGRAIYPPRGRIVADFNDQWYPSGWTGTGDLAGLRTSTLALPHQYGYRLDTCVRSCDPETGTVTSAPFILDHDWLALQVAGGRHPLGSPGATAVRLVVDGQTVRTATGRNSDVLDWESWDVSAWRGRTARIEVVDDNRTGNWGHLAIDQITLTDAAQPRWSGETAVNVIVDGRVVGSAAGKDSSTLRPAAIDLSGYVGRTARVQIVDSAATGPWGHLLFDQLELADTPAG